MEDPTASSSSVGGSAAECPGASGSLAPEPLASPAMSSANAKSRFSPSSAAGLQRLPPPPVNTTVLAGSVSKALSGSKEHGKALQRTLVEQVEVSSGSGAKKSFAAVGKQQQQAAVEDSKVEPIRTVISDMLRDPSASADPATVANAAEILVLSMAENMSSPQVQEYCIWALSDLARKAEENCTCLIKAGAFERVVAGMASAPGSASMQERGCGLLWQLALKEEGRAPFVKSGACWAIVEALRNHPKDETVVTAALGAVKPVSIVDYGRRAFEALGAAEAVARAMTANSGVPGIMSEGCSVLSNLAVDIANNRVSVAGSAELDAILGAMMEHPTDRAVQKHACFVLKNLTFSDQNLRILAEHGLPVEELLDHVKNFEETRADAEVIMQRLQKTRSSMAEEAARKASPPTPAREAPHPRLAMANEVQHGAMASGERGEYKSALEQLHVALKMKRAVYGEDAANDDLVYVLNCMGYLCVLCGDLPSAVSWYEESLGAQRRMPDVSPADLAKTMTDVAALCFKTGDLDKAETCLLMALDAKKGADGSLPHDAAKDVENLADLYRAKGDADKAEKLYIHAAKCYKSSPLPGADRAIAQVVTKLAGLAGLLGHLDLAQGRFEMALELRRKMCPEGPSHEIVEALNNLGYARALNGNDLDAISSYEESVVMLTELLESADENLANTHSTLGVLHLKTGDPAAARDNFESALFIRQDIYGDEDPAQARSFYSLLTNLGEACALDGDLESAEQYYRSALKYVSQISPKEASTLLAVLGNLSSERGDYETAHDCFTRALTAAKLANASSGGTGNPVVDLSEMLSKLGNVCSILRNYAAAIDKYELSLKVGQRKGGPQFARGEEAANTTHALGVAHLRRGSLASARTNLKQALDTKKRLYAGARTAKESLSVAESHRAMGDVLARGQDYDGAEDQYEKALSALEKSAEEKDDDGEIMAALASVRMEMGNLAGIRGDVHSAQDHYREALELRRVLCSGGSGAPTPELVESLNKLGYAHAVNGENPEALELYEESLEAQRIINGDSDAAGNVEMVGTIRTVEVLRARC